MGRKNKKYDIGGMRLFGNCQKHGRCICGRCVNALINQKQQVKITSRDGSIKYQEASAMAEEPKFNKSFNPSIKEESRVERFRRLEREKLDPTQISVPEHAAPFVPRHDPIGEKEAEFMPDEREGVPFTLEGPPYKEAPKKPRVVKPWAEQKRKKCPDCGVVLRSDHKCKAGSGKNGPVRIIKQRWHKIKSMSNFPEKVYELQCGILLKNPSPAEYSKNVALFVKDVDCPDCLKDYMNQAKPAPEIDRIQLPNLKPKLDNPVVVTAPTNQEIIIKAQGVEIIIRQVRNDDNKQN